MFESDTVYFSVILPVYNAKETIGSTVNSVLKQTYRNFELIIINDGSVDASYEIISHYLDKRIRILNNSSNLGVAESRNIAIRSAKGKYISFIDSDDTWTPDKLEVQYRASQQERDATVIFSNYFIKKYDKVYDANIKFSSERKFLYSDLLHGGNKIGMLTAIVKREALGEKNIFRSIGHEDYDFWLRVLGNGAYAHFVNQKLAYYNAGVSGISSNKIKSAQWTWQIYRNQPKVSWVGAILLEIEYILHSLRSRKEESFDR
jgi:glycosyltransferase involved in cell wall biosynthesis